MMSILRQQFPADDFALLALVLVLPLIGAFVNGVFGKRLGKEGVRLMALASVGGAFLLSLVVFAALAGEPVPAEGPGARLTWTAWEWFTVNGRSGSTVSLDVAFSVDALSATMALVVTGVGFLIHLYSTGYMDKDPGYHRFFSYMNLFIFSMMVLILGDNLAVLFVGWEGVGLCSYLLIGFWFEDETKASAGKKAFITNRIGDFGLLIAMAMLVYYAGTLSWSGLEAGAGGLQETRTVWPLGNLQASALPSFLAEWLTPDKPIQMQVATMVALALFLGCVGKSAQVPLFVWLPDAMAGPTPVSALIHAATMVTAGVYLVARTSFIFALSPAAMAIVAITGAVTALLAATIAFAQNDLKKVLAYSTVSQLGFMFMGVGVGAFAAGFFHVITHAFFKGCLFLCAGSVIHAMHVRVHDDDRSQDMRFMGGLRKYMPITHVTFLLSCLAIAGCPPLSGFWSKDEILYKAATSHVIAPNAQAWMPPAWWGQLIYAIGIVAAVGTAFYMFRAYFMTFWGDFRGWKIVKRWKDRGHGHHDHGAPAKAMKGPVPHESPWTMTLPLAVLSGLAVVAGLLYAEPIHIAPLEHFWEPVFRTASESIGTSEGAAAALWPLLMVGISAFVVGSGASYLVYVKKRGQPAASFVAAWPRLHRIVYDKWRIDELYQVTIIGMLDALGETAAQVDRLVIDGIIAKLTALVTALCGTLLRALQTGRVQVYAAGMVLGTAAIGWFMLSPHADAAVDDSELRKTGTLSLTATPGHGYRYRWHLEGEDPPKDFTTEADYRVSLQRCETKRVHLAVQNALGSVDEQSYTHCRETREGCCLPLGQTPKVKLPDKLPKLPQIPSIPRGKHDAGIIKQLLNPDGHKPPGRPGQPAPGGAR
ncbi:MAG: NADH-quinone oxidoreductase subunit L [Deltaproteobacteria bacterium]|nr:MAG: NADH-quinone oxidoreductase subunit L [Deltaproteobacteria bacterium]